MRNHVQIHLDRLRNLRFDINAFADAEALMGGSVLEILGNETGLLRFSVQRALLWAGLKHEDPSLTPQKVGSLMQEHLTKGHSLTDLMKAVNDGILASGLISEPKEGDNGNPPPASA